MRRPFLRALSITHITYSSGAIAETVTSMAYSQIFFLLFPHFSHTSTLHPLPLRSESTLSPLCLRTKLTPLTKKERIQAGAASLSKGTRNGLEHDHLKLPAAYLGGFKEHNRPRATHTSTARIQ